MTTILPPSSGLPPVNGPSVDAFRESAQKAAEVRVSVDGSNFVVLGQGQMAGSSGSRSVAWVQGETDTTSMFVQAMAQSFGAGVSAAVARELGLDAAPGKPLASRVVQQALDIAETSKKALTGVDFLTQLDHSAKANGPAFRAAAAQAGVDPASLTPAQRETVDKDVRARFEAAASAGTTPVPVETAAGWVKTAILLLTKAPV